MENQKELQKKIFELTLALYRVTDFFPPHEALRKHLREKANEIFSGISEYAHSEDHDRGIMIVLAKIESIRGYARIARSLHFVKPINLSVLEREYHILAALLKRELDSQKQEPKRGRENGQHIQRAVEEEPDSPLVSLQEIALPTWGEFSAKEEMPVRSSAKREKVTITPRPTPQEISERQKKIIAYIQEMNRAKVSDFFSVFQDLSSKTIQRDLQDLVVRNMLRKEGEKRWTTYFLNS